MLLAGGLDLFEDARLLNSDVFSLTRLQIMSSLAIVGDDGITYRELKASLGLTDGALYTNLKALERMKYLTEREVLLEGKRLTAYKITGEGFAEWAKTKEWLKKLVECGEGRK